MSHAYSAKEICERALRMVGVFPITETAAEAEELAEALHWLDMIIAHTSGTYRTFWLVPDNARIDLAPAQAVYPLALVPDGVQFTIEAMLDDGRGSRRRLRILSRREWENLTNITRFGLPEVIYVDRLLDSTLRVHPTPPDSLLTPVAVDLTYQRFADDFADRKGNRALGIRTAWNLWLATKLAATLGNGPIRRLPLAEINFLETQAARLWSEIYEYENREHVGYPRQVALRDW